MNHEPFDLSLHAGTTRTEFKSSLGLRIRVRDLNLPVCDIKASLTSPRPHHVH